MELSHPAVQTILAPLLVALLAGALLPGRARGACVGLGMLASLLITRGIAWPPASGLDKLTWLVAAALLLGLLLDVLGVRRGLQTATMLVALSAALLWLAYPQLGAAGVVLLLEVAAVLAAGVLVSVRLPALATAPATVSAMLATAALGTAIVAFNGGSLAIAQAAGALAVAGAVLTAITWLLPAANFGASAVLAGGGAWVLLLGLVVLLTDTSRPALALLPLAFLADLASRRLPAGRGRAGVIVASVWTALVAALPLALAVYLSVALRGANDLYY